MKSLFPLIILAFIFTGCQKSGNTPEPQTEVKKTEVTFTVADFAQSVKGFAAVNTKGTMAVGDTLSNYADNLYYAIYNADGSFLKSGTQTKTDANFGRVTEQLAPGNYDVVMAAYKGLLYIFFGSGTSYSQTYFNPPSPYSWVEVFSKSVNINVAATPLTQSVRLDRIVGALDIVLTDVMPASADHISVTLNNEAYNILAKTGTPTMTGTVTPSFAVSAADKGARNKKISLLIGNTTSDLNLTLQAFDAANNKLAEKAITTRIYKNQRTTLSGSLFGPTTAGFTVFVNPVWNPSGAVVTF
jgi:hypothetical protein